jgi:hypothetical protein
MRQRGAGDTDRNQKHVNRTVKGVSRKREAQLVIIVSVVGVGVRGDRVIVCEHVMGAPREGEDCRPLCRMSQPWANAKGSENTLFIILVKTVKMWLILGPNN